MNDSREAVPTPQPITPAAELEAKLGAGVPVLVAGDVQLDRGLRLCSGARIAGIDSENDSLKCVGDGLQWGDSATVQALQGHDFGIGSVDAITRTGKTTGTVPDESAAHYAPGTLVWTWAWTDTGVRVGPSRRHVVVTRNGNALTLDPAPHKSANAICWTRNAVPVLRAREGDWRLTATAPHLLGRVVLVSDGMQIANESRGELRRVVGVRDGIQFDRPIRRADYKRGQCVVAPVNVIANVEIRDLLIFPGPSGWSFYGKWMYGVRFENCVFNGVVEINQSAHVEFINCHGRHLKLNCAHDVRVTGGSWTRVSFEECCADVEIAHCDVYCNAQLNGIATDPQQGCERITVRDSRISEPTPGSPIALEGRECRIERVRIRCGPSDGHVYLTGKRVGAIDVDSDRGIVFKGGTEQFAQRLKAPGISLGWTDGGQSYGTALALETPQLTNMDGRWEVVQ